MGEKELQTSKTWIPFFWRWLNWRNRNRNGKPRWDLWPQSTKRRKSCYCKLVSEQRFKQTCGGFDDNNVRLQTCKYLAKRRHLLQPDAFSISLVNRVQKFMSKKPKACNKEGQYERSLSIPELNSKRKNSTISGWRSELLEKRGERCKLDPTRKVCSSLDRRKSSQREYCIPVELKSTQKKEKVFSV